MLRDEDWGLQDAGCRVRQMKHKISNLKLQITNKSQTSIFNDQNMHHNSIEWHRKTQVLRWFCRRKQSIWNFEFGSLKFIWDLEFGAWNLSYGLRGMGFRLRIADCRFRISKIYAAIVD